MRSPTYAYVIPWLYLLTNSLLVHSEYLLYDSADHADYLTGYGKLSCLGSEFYGEATPLKGIFSATQKRTVQPIGIERNDGSFQALVNATDLFPIDTVAGVNSFLRR